MIGINDGAAAGQTIGHLHVHLIPIRSGDRPDPRGGVRWIILDRADYWTGRALGFKRSARGLESPRRRHASLGELREDRFKA